VVERFDPTWIVGLMVIDRPRRGAAAILAMAHGMPGSV
jgi:hypothetical protein